MREAGFPTAKLSPTARELNALLDRVLVRGAGWGPRDPQRGARAAIELHPALLAAKATKAGRAATSARVWRKAAAQLEALGVLTVRRSAGRPSVVWPSWWRDPDGQPVPESAARLVWIEAARRLGRSDPVPTPFRPLALESEAPQGEAPETPETTERKTSSVASQPRSAAPTAVPAAPVQTGPGRLLVADPQLRAKAGRLLARHGWKLIAAVNGAIEDGYPEPAVIYALEVASCDPTARNRKALFNAVLIDRCGLLETTRARLEALDAKRSEPCTPDPAAVERAAVEARAVQLAREHRDEGRVPNLDDEPPAVRERYVQLWTAYEERRRQLEAEERELRSWAEAKEAARKAKETLREHEAKRRAAATDAARSWSDRWTPAERLALAKIPGASDPWNRRDEPACRALLAGICTEGGVLR